MTTPDAFEPRVEDFVEGLQPLAAELGAQATVEIVRIFGGARLYVPQRWRPDLDLNLIGVEAAQALCATFGPERIDIPRHPYTAQAMRRRLDSLRATGMTNGAAARALGVSWRTVTRLAAPGREAPRKGRRRFVDERQIDLVDYLDERPR
jgi:hypothetical protein